MKNFAFASSLLMAVVGFVGALLAPAQQPQHNPASL